MTVTERYMQTHTADGATIEVRVELHRRTPGATPVLVLRPEESIVPVAAALVAEVLDCYPAFGGEAEHDRHGNVIRYPMHVIEVATHVHEDFTLFYEHRLLMFATYRPLTSIGVTGSRRTLPDPEIIPITADVYERLTGTPSLKNVANWRHFAGPGRNTYPTLMRTFGKEEE